MREGQYRKKKKAGVKLNVRATRMPTIVQTHFTDRGRQEELHKRGGRLKRRSLAPFPPLQINRDVNASVSAAKFKICADRETGSYSDEFNDDVIISSDDSCPC